MSEINLHIEKLYAGAEMLPLERKKIYTWTSELIKPKNILDIGCGTGGGTYYLSEGLKECSPDGKVYSCDPERSPSQEFFSQQPNVNYYCAYSTDLIEGVRDDEIDIGYIFHDGPDDPNVGMNDIKLLETFIKPGCYFTMHDWETEPRKYDNGVANKARLIRPYMESDESPWQPIEVLDGIESAESVGLCLYKFTGI